MLTWRLVEQSPLLWQVTAKNPFETPGPPGTPKIVSYSPTGVSLSWNPPEDNGGNPVSGQ